MRAHIQKAQEMWPPKHPLDLPGYWTRPTLVHEPTAADVALVCRSATNPDFSCTIECSSSQRMLAVLRQVHRQCVMAIPGSTPADPAGLVLKVRGMHDFLDGDEHLIDYGYIRKCIQKQVAPQLTILLRDSIIQECKDQQAEILNEDDLEEGSDSDDDPMGGLGYGELESDEFDRAGDKADWQFIPISELHRSFRLRVVGVDSLPAQDGQCVRQAKQPAAISISALRDRSSTAAPHPVHALCLCVCKLRPCNLRPRNLRSPTPRPPARPPAQLLIGELTKVPPPPPLPAAATLHRSNSC
eukprot:SAG22_NODE_527_length_9437_cov_3.575712_8_plen_299_part_00